MKQVENLIQLTESRQVRSQPRKSLNGKMKLRGMYKNRVKDQSLGMNGISCVYYYSFTRFVKDKNTLYIGCIFMYKKKAI